MVKKENKHSMYLLVIVAIVAVVGIVLMVNNGNCNSTIDTNEISLAQDLAGEAHGRDRDDNDRNDDDRDRKIESPDSRDDPSVTIPLGGSDEEDKTESNKFTIPNGVGSIPGLESSRPENIEKFPRSIVVDIPQFVEIPEGNGLVPGCIPKVKCVTTITLVLTGKEICTTEEDCNEIETCKEEKLISVKCKNGKGCPEWLDISQQENPQEAVDKWCDDDCTFSSQATGNEICDTEELCDKTQNCEPMYEPIETTECSWVC